MIEMMCSSLVGFQDFGIPMKKIIQQFVHQMKIQPPI
jgi:hypothetical protein